MDRNLNTYFVQVKVDRNDVTDCVKVTPYSTMGIFTTLVAETIMTLCVYIALKNKIYAKFNENVIIVFLRKNVVCKLAAECQFQCV